MVFLELINSQLHFSDEVFISIYDIFPLVNDRQNIIKTSHRIFSGKEHPHDNSGGCHRSLVEPMTREVTRPRRSGRTGQTPSAAAPSGQAHCCSYLGQQGCWSSSAGSERAAASAEPYCGALLRHCRLPLICTLHICCCNVTCADPRCMYFVL